MTPLWLSIVLAVAGVVVAPSLTLLGVQLTLRANNARAQIEADLRVAEAKQKGLSDSQFQLCRDFLIQAQAVLYDLQTAVETLKQFEPGSADYKQVSTDLLASLNPSFRDLQKLLMSIEMLAEPPVRVPARTVVLKMQDLSAAMQSTKSGAEVSVSEKYVDCTYAFGVLLKVIRKELTGHEDELTFGVGE